MLKEKNFKAKLINKYSKAIENFTHFARCLININNKGLGELDRYYKDSNLNRIKSFVQKQIVGVYFPGGKEQFKSGDIIEWAPLIPSS